MIVYIGIRDISDFNMIEIITTSLFVFSSIYGGATIDSNITATTTAPGASSRIEERMTSKELEARAKEYFKTDPILVDIARCESSFRHLDEDGKILRGTVNKSDLGLMQINEYYHADRALGLGLDLKTLEGNMAYAKDLYEREGSKPWISSSKCWKQATKTKSGELVAINR
ncbi:MAG: hypothetical protein WC933_01880 [Candidatus Paceibacterota bacterium]|jgi:hypothetical protein